MSDYRISSRKQKEKQYHLKLLSETFELKDESEKQIYLKFFPMLSDLDSLEEKSVLMKLIYGYSELKDQLKQLQESEKFQQMLADKFEGSYKWVSAQHDNQKTEIKEAKRVMQKQEESISQLEPAVEKLERKIQTMPASNKLSENSLEQWKKVYIPDILLCSFNIGYSSALGQKKLREKEVESIYRQMIALSGHEFHRTAVELLWNEHQLWFKNKDLLHQLKTIRP